MPEPLVARKDTNNLVAEALVLLQVDIIRQGVKQDFMHIFLFVQSVISLQVNSVPR